MEQHGHSIVICPIRDSIYCYSCSQPLIIRAATQTHLLSLPLKNQKPKGQLYRTQKNLVSLHQKASIHRKKEEKLHRKIQAVSVQTTRSCAIQSKKEICFKSPKLSISNYHPTLPPPQPKV